MQNVPSVAMDSIPDHNEQALSVLVCIGHTLNPSQRLTLAAVVDRILPQPAEPFSLIAQIESQFAGSAGDVSMPSVAYADALDTLDQIASVLHNLPFAELTPHNQDEILAQIAARGPIEIPHLSRWLHGLRRDAIVAWRVHCDERTLRETDAGHIPSDTR